MLVTITDILYPRRLYYMLKATIEHQIGYQTAFYIDFKQEMVLPTYFKSIKLLNNHSIKIEASEYKPFGRTPVNFYIPFDAKSIASFLEIVSRVDERTVCKFIQFKNELIALINNPDNIALINETK